MLALSNPRPSSESPRYPTMSLWRSYTSLTPNTRLFFGLGVLAWGAAGLFFSDGIESALGMKPSEKETKEMDGWIPKVSVIDRENDKKG